MVLHSILPQEITRDQILHLTTTTAGTQAHVLLQTAKGRACSASGSWLTVHVLLDRGSQKSYITDELRSKLGLNPIKVEALNLNTLGSDSYKRKQCDLVKGQLKWKSHFVFYYLDMLV